MCDEKELSRLREEVKFLRERAGHMHEDVEERWKRLITERDEARADLARSVAAWEAAGMQGRTAHDALIVIAEERDEALAEVERSKREHDEMFAELRDLSKKYDEGAAYRRGAEAMLEAAFEAMLQMNVSAHRTECAEMVRALPIPEDK